MDVEAIKTVLCVAGLSYERFKENPRRFFGPGADSTWTDINLNDSDRVALAMMTPPSNVEEESVTPFGAMLGLVLELIDGFAGVMPILLLVVALGLLLLRRYRRLRRERSMRREFDKLRTCAFLPDQLMEL